MNNGIFPLALLFHYFFYNTEELVNYNNGCEPVFWIRLTFSRIWIDQNKNTDPDPHPNPSYHKIYVLFFSLCFG